MDNRTRFITACNEWEPSDNYHLAIRYIQHMEKQLTDDVCLCLWILHPDDIDKPPTEKRRKRKSDEHPACPVHTREGLLTDFLEWVADATRD